MRLLVIDIELTGLDICNRAAEAGHDVRWFRPTQHPLGEGFKGVKVVDDWEGSMAWAREGLILTTGNAKYTARLDRYRDLGFDIFGPTAASAALEIDRAKGMEAMKACEISLPEYHIFSNLKDAEAYAAKCDYACVFKPMGSEDDKALTYVASDPADMVGWLQRQQKRGLSLKGACMLQERIEMVAEFGVSGWFGPEGFLEEKWQENFEFKKLLANDLGPSTGEEGTVCKYVKESKLADQFLKPMEPILRTLGHRGDFAIGVGITKDGKAYPFEFTSRLGWPAFFIQTASHKGDPIQWMRDLLDGNDTLKVDRRVAIGVVASQPPYPKFNGDADCIEGMPIYGLEDVWLQAHPIMLQRGVGPVMRNGKVASAPQIQSAGELLFVMTGLGATVEGARRAVYAALDQISYSDKQWRCDIGARLEKQLPRLHEFGYAKELEA